MIFYFTATGNSLFAAEKIAAATGDSLVSIGQALRGDAYEYDITGEEYLGFVIPTFAYKLPGAVGLFLEKLVLHGYAGQYTYGVFTCGGGSGFEAAALYTMLQSRGIALAAAFELVMPDNFILWSEAPSPARVEALLNNAEKQLDGISSAIKARQTGRIDAGTPQGLCMKLEEFSTTQHTSKLHADDKCTACGLCAEICPMRCIEIESSGRPVWEGRCTMCLACLHRCPAHAVQFGGDTQHKGRYVNPRVKF